MSVALENNNYSIVKAICTIERVCEKNIGVCLLEPNGEYSKKYTIKLPNSFENKLKHNVLVRRKTSSYFQVLELKKLLKLKKY